MIFLNIKQNIAKLLCLFSITCAAQTNSMVELRGTDLSGGAQKQFGSVFYGQTAVNYIYAQSTGSAATMTADFTLKNGLNEPLFLVVEGADDDTPGSCRVRITLNDHAVLEGPNGFPEAQWGFRRFEIPDRILHSGTNRLSFTNLEPTGKLGTPPWFMVARCRIVDRSYQVPLTPSLPTLSIRIPDKSRPLPEPLLPPHTEPGFKFRGIKGWGWTPEQYLEEVPVLASYKMNFLMNCYLSMFTSTQLGAWKNEWWKPLPIEKKEAYARVIEACRTNNIQFCFAMHPQLASPRPLNPGSAQDIDLFYQHFEWAQSQGVHWFSVSLDDVSWGEKGPAAGGAQHAALVNTVLERLRKKDSGAQLIFCPGPYWGDGTAPEHRPYLEAIARDMHPDVYVFWAGDAVTTPAITHKAAQTYRGIVKHRLFLWDNYPVNDGAPTMHLGPVSGRDTDLCEIIDGYMSNPMHTQTRINRIPLATCADYAYNPWAYDPDRSIGQIILRLGDTAAKQEILKELVEEYPGFIIAGGGTGSNPLRAKFTRLVAMPESRTKALELIQHMENIRSRLAELFPKIYSASEKTIDDDVVWMKGRL